MSKARESWHYREFSTSEKLNRAVQDYISPGLLIMHVQGHYFDEAAIGVPVPPDPIYFGWYPYNPAKIIFDRLRIQGTSIIPGGTWEYSLDSGATWNDILPATGSLGVPMSNIFNTASPVNYRDVDLSGIASLQHIGFRLDRSSSWIDQFAAWNYQLLLYSSTQSPF